VLAGPPISTSSASCFQRDWSLQECPAASGDAQDMAAEALADWTRIRVNACTACWPYFELSEAQGQEGNGRPCPEARNFSAQYRCPPCSTCAVSGTSCFGSCLPEWQRQLQKARYGFQASAAAPKATLPIWWSCWRELGYVHSLQPKPPIKG